MKKRIALLLCLLMMTISLAGCFGGDSAPGADGADGAPGADGVDGVDGTNGTDGAPGADGADGTNGIDGADGAPGADGVDGADGTNGTDGADGAPGADGVDGTNGSASPNTMLTSISTPAASLECYAGGRVIAQGLDNGDGGGTAQNGVLESGEIDYTTTYCNKYGSPEEIYQVFDINSGDGSTPGEEIGILVGDTIYFSATDGSTGEELWAHDTSNHSTWQVADIMSGTSDSNPGRNMQMLVGDTIYFDAYNGTGIELWAHDTSNHSTWQVADINSGSPSSSPGANMAMLVGDTIYFSASDWNVNSNTGTELWAHDTSNHSTWQVADIRSGGLSSNPGFYMAMFVGDTIYFSANDGSTGTELMGIEFPINYVIILE